MKKSRYTEEQIAFALKQAETGTLVAEVIRRMACRSNLLPLEEVYGGLGVGELRRVKQLEEETYSLRITPAGSSVPIRRLRASRGAAF